MYRVPKLVIHRRFDFEIGHLVKSPCKACCDRPLLPECANGCSLLDRIQTRLARGISTTHSHSPLEPFAIYLESASKE
jgi:hypothetical protein